MSMPKVEHPLLDVTLPSNKKKIKVRPMLTKDQKILLIAKEGNQISDMLAAIKQVCNNCLTDDTNVDTLTTFDIEYLFLKLRSFSVNNISKQSYTDMEDQKIYDFEIDLDKINVKYPEKPVATTIKVDGNISLVLKFPQAKIYDDSDLFAQTTDVTDRIAAYCLDKIYVGETAVDVSLQTKQEVKDFIDNLDLKSFLQIRLFIDELPKLHHEIKYKNSLDHERTITLSALNDFFTF